MPLYTPGKTVYHLPLVHLYSSWTLLDSGFFMGVRVRVNAQQYEAITVPLVNVVLMQC